MMETGNIKRPSYLPLLNTIAIHERNSGVSLKAWADKTPNKDLRTCLNIVAARETSHYEIFKRRINELGFSLQEEEEPGHEERLIVRGSDLPDREKIRRIRKVVMTADYRSAVSDDTTDELTQSLLKWFADEEADSAGRLVEAYDMVENEMG